jgi:hypothetical protein
MTRPKVQTRHRYGTPGWELEVIAEHGGPPAPPPDPADVIAEAYSDSLAVERAAHAAEVARLRSTVDALRDVVELQADLLARLRAATKRRTDGEAVAVACERMARKHPKRQAATAARRDRRGGP